MTTRELEIVRVLFHPNGIQVNMQSVLRYSAQELIDQVAEEARRDEIKAWHEEEFIAGVM